jgi:hypothetical protein
MTLSSGLSVDPTALQTPRYAVGRRRFPYDILVQSVNAAYRALGHIPQVDQSLLTTVQTTQYTIPVAAREQLREVYMQTRLSMPLNWGWFRLPYGYWYQERDLLFVPQLPVPRYLKLVYMAEPTELALFDDQISDLVHEHRIIYRAAAEALLWRAERLSPAQLTIVMNRVNALLDQDKAMEYEHPIKEPQRGNKILTIPLISRDERIEPYTPPNWVKL